MIFCVEDDDSIRELVVYALTSSGFQAAGFADSASFWQAMGHTMPESCKMLVKNLPCFLR